MICKRIRYISLRKASRCKYRMMVLMMPQNVKYNYLTNGRNNSVKIKKIIYIS